MEAGRNERRANKRRFKNIISLILLIGVFLLWGFYALLESDLLNLKHIEVYGNSAATYEEIVDASKLVLHRNVYKYDMGIIEENLLQHPYIKEVKINRKLPNRFVLNVTEREEYAIISYMGSYVYVDNELMTLKISESYIAGELPLINNVEFHSLKAGEKARVINQDNLINAVKVIAAAKVSDIIDIIAEVDIAEEDNIRIMTRDGIEVFLGKGEDPVYSMLVLKEVLVKLYTNNRRNVIIDLRYQGTSTVRDRN